MAMMTRGRSISSSSPHSKHQSTASCDLHRLRPHLLGEPVHVRAVLHQERSGVHEDHSVSLVLSDGLLDQLARQVQFVIEDAHDFTGLLRARTASSASNTLLQYATVSVTSRTSVRTMAYIPFNSL